MSFSISSEQLFAICLVTSILDAKLHLSHNTSVSSPISVSAWNSSDSKPPITPVSAFTILYFKCILSNAFLYASNIFLYDISKPSKFLSNEYASFITNSLTLISPYLGLGSSLNLVWNW